MFYVVCSRWVLLETVAGEVVEYVSIFYGKSLR